MKLHTIKPNSIQIKPILVCCCFILIISFIGISMISLKSGGFSLRPAAKRFLGMKTRSDSKRLCNQLTRRESINWNSFYYYKNPTLQKDLIWCKVPKAASTTLTKLFLRLAGSKQYQNNTRVHKLLRDFYPRLSNKLMKDKMKSATTFMVSRDPFERILSAYRDKLENYNRDLIFRDGYYYEHYGRFMVQPEVVNISINSNETSTNSTRREPTWREFVQYLLKTSVARYDEHWMPMTNLCSPCQVQYDYIIRMDLFERDVLKPLRSAGISAPKVGRFHTTGTANKKLVEKYFKTLTMSEMKKLYTKYKRDFLLFGYTPYKYFRLLKT